jgi:branched-chain amino acid transport system ATP-binding protein
MSLLAVQDLVAGYVPDVPIVRGVSLALEAGEVLTIIGPNGAGKSTLVKAVAGLVDTFGGHVSAGEQRVTGMKAHAIIRAGIGYVPQVANIFTTLSVHENLRVGGYTVGREFAARAERVYTLFPDLAAHRKHQGRALSGGQRQMLAFARALVAEPKILILDEPSAGLSPKMTQLVFAKTRELAGHGIGILMVEQNARAALAISDRAVVLVEGRERLTGPAAKLLDDPAVGELYLGGRR